MPIDNALSYIDRSGTIEAGGVAQELAPAKGSRNGWAFFNNSSDVLVLSFAGTATATRGVEVPAKTLYEAPPTQPPSGAISIFGANTGQAFTFWEW